ncbi:MAG: HEAT repeat domain-containing protein [Nitrospira sp.]|nr:MAG: HEAT repeat domain-containing protein [Nitrospira sp.]
MQPMLTQRIIFTLSEWYGDMRPSQPRLVMLLSMMVLMGLAGCGQTSSDNPPNLGPRASVGAPPVSKPSPSTGNNSVTPVPSTANPTPLALGKATGGASGKEAGAGEGSSHEVPIPPSKAEDMPGALVVPAWIAKELDSPDVNARLRALDTWALSAPSGAIDPLILALEDKDERVQVRAMELIEQDQGRGPRAEQFNEGAEDANEIQESGDTEVVGEGAAVGPSNK